MRWEPVILYLWRSAPFAFIYLFLVCENSVASITAESQPATFQRDRGKIICGFIVARFGPDAIGDGLRSLMRGGDSSTYPRLRSRFSNCRVFLAPAYWRALSFNCFCHHLLIQACRISRYPAGPKSKRCLRHSAAHCSAYLSESGGEHSRTLVTRDQQEHLRAGETLKRNSVAAIG